jgi:hypothetical protein
MPEPQYTPYAEDADKIFAAPPQSFLDWMADQGLEIGNAVERPHWGTILSHLRSLGLLDAGQLWIKDQADKLCRVWGVSGRKRVCTEICRRFVRAKMDKAGAQLPATKVGEYTAELDALPDYLRWVFLHPGLVGKEDCDIRKAAASKYERKNAAPNQGAVNMYNHCREDEKARQKMFDEVKAVLLEERKKRKAPVSEQDQRELERIGGMKKGLDMAVELAKLKGAG